jgi:mycothiol synthase
MDGTEAAAGAVCSVSESIGWVDNLGVRKPWRRQGLGMALLRHAAHVFRSQGISRMALGVDSENPTGASRLYERAGMHIAQRHATYRKVLREGEVLYP